MRVEVSEDYEYLRKCSRCGSDFRIEQETRGTTLYAFDDSGALVEVDDHIIERYPVIDIYCEDCSYMYVYGAKILYNFRTEKHRLIGGRVLIEE